MNVQLWFVNVSCNEFQDHAPIPQRSPLCLRLTGRLSWTHPTRSIQSFCTTERAAVSTANNNYSCFSLTNNLSIEVLLFLSGGRLANFEVRVGDLDLGLGDNDLCYNYPGTVADNAIETIECDSPKPVGRYVSIQRTGGVLTLCEVQVYGSKGKLFCGEVFVHHNITHIYRFI